MNAAALKHLSKSDPVMRRLAGVALLVPLASVMIGGCKDLVPAPAPSISPSAILEPPMSMPSATSVLAGLTVSAR